MPLYEYQCESCSHRFELIRKYSDPPPAACPKCGAATITKLVSSPAFQFKGTGFYETDYRKKTESGTSSSKSEGSDSKGTKDSKDSKSSAESSSSKDSSSNDSSSKDSSPKDSSSKDSSSKAATPATTTTTSKAD